MSAWIDNLVEVLDAWVEVTAEMGEDEKFRKLILEDPDFADNEIIADLIAKHVEAEVQSRLQAKALEQKRGRL